jgi:adenylylsulfate kinase-like enzyme
LDVCRARDPKHLYQRADSGMIRDLPGVDAPYEPPEAPDLVVDTDQQTPEAAADAVIAGIPRLRHLLLEQFDS